MPERQLRNRKEVNFVETMNPDIRGIWDSGRYAGVLLLGGEEIVAEWPTKNGSAIHTPLRVLKAVVKENDRIVKERRQKK